MLAHGAILGRAAGIPGKEHEQIHPLGDLSVRQFAFPNLLYSGEYTLTPH